MWRCKLTCSLLSAWMLMTTAAVADDRPNIVFMLVDNLGYGDIGAYGGGELRGAPTPRLDRLAREGLRLTNFNVEPECTPSRSALLTGRMPIRSGTSAVDVMGGLEGMTPWEYTLAELLSDAGYHTAIYGKWHLGNVPGRYPTDQGFDEWWGIPRSSNSPLRTLQPGYDPSLTGGEQPVLAGRRGEPVERVASYDLEMRRRIDRQITERAVSYIESHAGAARPFFLYLPFTQPHSPPLPHPDFDRPGRSDYQNTLVEIDHNAGKVLDAIERAGIGDNTLVVWASDNGPETMQGIGIQHGGQSDSGPFRGEFPSAWEGAIRVPAILRWPGRIAPGRVSNQMVSILDFYRTFAALLGVESLIPGDRVVDSLDLGGFLFGNDERSPREHLMIFYGQDLLAIKWRNYKVHMAVKVASREPTPSAGQSMLTAYHQPLNHPWIFDLENDPKELWNTNGANQWLSEVLAPIVQHYYAGLQRHPNLAPGRPGPTER